MTSTSYKHKFPRLAQSAIHAFFPLIERNGSKFSAASVPDRENPDASLEVMEQLYNPVVEALLDGVAILTSIRGDHGHITDFRAERLRRLVFDTPIPTTEGDVRISVSLGVSSMNRGSEAMGDLIKRVDALLYRAKQCGRNRVVVHGNESSH